MGSGKFAIDHDRFVMKNRMLAAAEDVQRRDRDLEKKGIAQADRPREASCFNCKLKKKCSEFRSTRTGYATGVASFGGGSDRAVCSKYEPAPAESRGMSDKQIKALMKNFKR
jgi:hypothetical protein